MIRYISITIFILVSQFTFSQVSSSHDSFYNIGVSVDGNTLTVSLEYDGTFPAGTVEGLPTTNESIADMAFALRWPSTTTITLGAISNVGGIAFIKSGGILSAGGFNYQKFISSGSANFATNMGLGALYDLFTIPMTTISGGGFVEVAPLGYLPNQPSLQIDYFNVPGGDIYEYFPPDIIFFAPLPIYIKSFSAVKDGDRSARLDWTSSSEVNSAYFGVERSSDGTLWETIGKVNAAGNSSAELAYQYYDRNLPISRSNDLVFYYRLQLVDIDGKYKYSDVRGVNFKGISSTDVISLYPNPTTSMVNIDLREMDINHGTIDLKVVDMAGRYVINKTINGNGIEAVDVSRFDAGTYQVMVTQGSKQHQKRFIKVN